VRDAGSRHEAVFRRQEAGRRLKSGSKEFGEEGIPQDRGRQAVESKILSFFFAIGGSKFK
jgi:hypothetical protein